MLLRGTILTALPGVLTMIKIGSYWVNPNHVVSVRSLGKGGSKGTSILLANGVVLRNKFPATQVIAALGLPAMGELT